MLILLRAARPLPAWPMIMSLPHMMFVHDINKAVMQMPKTAGHHMLGTIYGCALFEARGYGVSGSLLTLY